MDKIVLLAYSHICLLQHNNVLKVVYLVNIITNKAIAVIVQVNVVNVLMIKIVVLVILHIIYFNQIIHV